MQSGEKTVDHTAPTPQKNAEPAAAAQKEVSVAAESQTAEHTPELRQQAQSPMPPQAVQPQSVTEQPAAKQNQAPTAEPQVAVVSQPPVEASVQPQVAVSVPPVPVSAERTAFSQNNEYALIKNKATVDPLAPKKLERMMKVTTSDKLPLK